MKIYGIYTLAAEESNYRPRTERERKEIDETKRRMQRRDAEEKKDEEREMEDAGRGVRNRKEKKHAKPDQ